MITSNIIVPVFFHLYIKFLLQLTRHNRHSRIHCSLLLFRVTPIHLRPSRRRCTEWIHFLIIIDTCIPLQHTVLGFIQFLTTLDSLLCRNQLQLLLSLRLFMQLFPPCTCRSNYFKLLPQTLELFRLIGVQSTLFIILVSVVALIISLFVSPALSE